MKEEVSDPDCVKDLDDVVVGEAEEDTLALVVADGVALGDPVNDAVAVFELDPELLRDALLVKLGVAVADEDIEGDGDAVMTEPGEELMPPNTQTLFSKARG